MKNMGAGVKSAIQAEESRKRLSRLRSVKHTNLDKFRLSMKRTKSRLSQEIVVPEDSMELNAKQKQKQSTTSKIQNSPNYMKATTCFSARSGSSPSPLNPGGTLIARKTAKGVKRMYSLKRVRRLPGGNVEQGDFKGAMEVAPAKLKLIRSGSIKISRVRSLKLVRRELSKSRFDQASMSMTDDDESAKQLSADSDAQKIMNSSINATSLKPVRTLYKMPSLRSKRRQQQVKKQSRFAESKATHFDQATCSWAIKSSKIQRANADHVSGKCESESKMIGHVCPYTYCSLHGHQHSPSPPLKGFISTKRRLLKKQQSVRLKHRLKTEASYRDVSRLKQSVQEHDDPLMSETQGGDEEGYVEIYAKLRDVSTPGIGAEVGDFGRIMSSEIGGESGEMDADSVSSGELNELSSVKDSTDVLLDSRKYANMWKLIHKHLAAPGNEALSDHGEKGKEETVVGTTDTDGFDHQDENQDVNLEDQVAGSEKLEFNQTEAIEFVQQAVDEILQLDEQSPLLPVSPKLDQNHDEIFRNAEEPDAPKELKDIQQTESGAIVPGKPIRQRSKGFEKLRKMIITAKFVKAIEKLRKINPRKPRFLSLEEQSKVEKVQLRRLVMDGRKNTEEWMLDFALQQVIAKLAPSQQRRVDLLVRAFERVAPETSIIHPLPKTLRTMSLSTSTDNVQEKERSIAIDLKRSQSTPADTVQEDREEERLIAIDLNSYRSSDIIVQDPDEENHIHPGFTVSEEKSVPEVHDNRSQPKVFEENGKQELESNSVDDLAKPAKDVLTAVSGNEENNYLFDKEKFTNVWHMVYRQFIAQEEDGVSTCSSTTRSSSSLSQSEIKQDVNQGDAIQLVQEAIDELLHLHEQLSDQQTPRSSKVAEQQNKLCSPESTDEADDQKVLERQTSKPLSRLKKLILSAKFIKTMEKLRKIRTNKTEELSSQGSSGAEKVFLRRSSTDERRNGEDWMLDNTLQHVISKLAPAQQKRVALLTQAFETFTPELEQISRSYKVKIQSEDRTGSSIKLNKVEDKFVIVPAPEDEVKDANFQVNTEGSYKEESDLKSELSSHKKETLNDSQDEEHKVYDPKYVLSEGKYSKMWQVLCQHVKSNSSAESEYQTTEIRARVDQYDDGSSGAGDAKDATFGKLEFTQSDVNKLVQEALDGILQQPSVNILSANEDKKFGDENKKAFPKYSRWKRAIICSKFIAAMERMQKIYTQKKRSYHNPLTSEQEAEIVHLRKCLMDERSNNEVWMLDYALRQAIAKLAPVQQRKVALLVEAFETVTPNTEDPTSKVEGDKTLSAPSAEETKDIGKATLLDGKKYSSMWRLIYKHEKSDANHNPDDAQIPTETDVNGAISDVDSDWSSPTENEIADQDSPSGNTELQQKDAIKLVEEAVNEILDMQVQSTDSEEKAIEEDAGQKEVQRTYNVMSKVVMCKKFIKAMEKMKKSKPKVKHNLPLKSEFSAESVRLRAQRMDDKKCEEWMLDYALQQVIGKMAPTQKKRVSSLVQAFERVA